MSLNSGGIWFRVMILHKMAEKVKKQFLSAMQTSVEVEMWTMVLPR